MKIHIEYKTEIVHSELIAQHVENYWIGIGEYGNKQLGNYTVCRFLRARSGEGICQYFFWSGERKGDCAKTVMRFIRKRKISKEKCISHFLKI